MFIFGDSTDTPRFLIYDFSALYVLSYSIFARFFVPLAMALSLSYLWANFSFNKLVVTLFLFVLSSIFLSLTLEKQFIIGFFLFLVLFFIFNKKILFSSYLALLGLVSFSVVSFLQYGHDLNLFDLFGRALHLLLYRLIMDPSYMFHIAFTHFPSDSNFLYGSGFSFLRYIPYLKDFYSVGSINNVAITSYGTVGDLWANFGWFGLFLAPLLGFFYGALLSKIIKVPSFFYRIFFLCIFISTIFWSFYSSFFGGLSIAITVLLIIAIYFSEKYKY